jgi:hypothetical protein
MNPEEIEKILETLSPRERGVYDLRIQGMTVEEVAQSMFISQSLIYNKVNPKIFKAFGVKNWEELEEKLKPPEETTTRTTSPQLGKIPFFLVIFMLCNLCFVCPQLVLPINAKRIFDQIELLPADEVNRIRLIIVAFYVSIELLIIFIAALIHKFLMKNVSKVEQT